MDIPILVIPGNCDLCDANGVPVAQIVAPRQVIAICRCCLALALEALDDEPQEEGKP